MKLIIHLLTIFSFLNSILLLCIPNKNCPKEKGQCKNNQCVCFDEFYSLNYQINKNDKFFCEYQKMSRFGPLILEFFLPTIGHLYAGKMNLFISKLIILFFPIICYFCGLTNVGTNPDGTYRNISNIKWFCLILFIISIIILPFYHICDFICYALGFYYDGNGVPFIQI